MNFNLHLNLKGKHAFLGGSNYHWVNYDDTKLAEVYLNRLAVEKGVQLHEFADQCIILGQKLPKSQKTLNMYVNDAIGYKMTPEQVLYFSENCFGTADAISFRDNLLRIHDLKTGASLSKMEQLYIYAALFCLEYSIDPLKIDIELRIYQSNNIEVCNPQKDIVPSIMDKIIVFDKIISNLDSSKG